jgi:catechol 2,3-dioxygenase-like lactoylglutathione lyase family enzyme
MLHHLSFAVSDLERSGRFYDAALGALGYVRVWSEHNGIGYGHPGGGDKFTLKANATGIAEPPLGSHLAFVAPSRAAVDAWYAAAMAAGAEDNGAPGLRPHYGPSYYAAFVYDPDGYALEAVTNEPES